MKIITLIFCFISVNLNAKELIYNITSSGISIGSITINKTTIGNQTIISANSKVKVNLFITLDVSYNLKSVYQDNKLLNSTVTTFVNGKEHSKTTTKRFDGYYLIISDEETNKISHPINYSGALLYFKHPNYNKVVYSEIYGIENTIKEISKTKYQITNSKNGHTSIYEYTNEIASKITINHTLLTFTLKLK
jgi:hypothetical protein